MSVMNLIIFLRVGGSRKAKTPCGISILRDCTSETESKMYLTIRKLGNAFSIEALTKRSIVLKFYNYTIIKKNAHKKALSYKKKKLMVAFITGYVL